MNKALKTVSIALILALTAAVSLSAASMDATVLSAKGKAEVQKNGTWTALKAGSTLQKGDVIQTGFKSELILKIKNTTVTVAPLSRITIEQLAAKSDKDDTRLFLDTGSLKSDVKKTEDRRVGFTVRSPVATASVRGTIVKVTNTFSGTVVDGLDGKTAAWASTKIQTPSIEQSDEETAEVTGNDASAVSDGQSGAGATLVRKNMTASYSSDGESSNPKDSAAKKTSDLGGAKLPSQEAAETTSAKITGSELVIRARVYIDE